MTKKRERSYRSLLIALLCCCLTGFAEAQKTEGTPESHGSGHSGHKQIETKPPSRKNPSAANFVIPDTAVLTQDGKPVNFYTDLVKGKKVLISFIFTSCRLACPMVGRNFQKLQEQIGKDLGKDIFLVSVSTDPKTDTPEILKKWGEKFDRREGWTLVTGDETKMKQLLLTLTGSSRQQEGEHTSIVIVYDGVSGGWNINSSLMLPIILLDELSKLGKKPAN